MTEPAESLFPGETADEAREKAEETVRNKTWQIEKWKPRHNQVLSLHLAGYKNTEIAAILDYSEEHISRVLNDPRARAAIAEIQHRQFKNVRMRLEQKLAKLGEEAVENLAETITANIKAGTPAKKHQDKMSWELYDRIFGAEDDQEPDGPTFSPETEQRLAEALEESQMIREAEEVDAVEKETEE